jgi:hypothetical protein
MRCRLSISQGAVGKAQSLVDSPEHPQRDGIIGFRCSTGMLAEPVGEIAMACRVVELDGLLKTVRETAVRLWSRSGPYLNWSRAASSIVEEISAPITRPEAPTIGKVIAAASPVPVQTSSTRHLGFTSAAASTVGTKSRDHRPTQRSYAEVSTARPGATWNPDPKLVSINPRYVVAKLATVEAERGKL